ncbi:MAG: carbohydrate kinase family protein, partial [Candidatus Anstonellales archaeon]
MRLDVVCVGHILYDVRCYVEELPKPDKTSIIRAPIEASGGGSAANVAVNCAMLGLKTGVVGNIGDDYNGKFLLSNFRRFGINTSEIRKFAGSTGMAIVLIDKSAEVEVIESIGVCERRRGIDEDYLKNTNFVHMTGTDLRLLKRTSDIARIQKKVVLFDPGRSRAKEGEYKLSKILKNTNYLFANKNEILLIGGGSDPKVTAREIADKYGLACILKSGADEVFFTSSRSEFSIKPPRVKPVDTIGAGDAFS